MIKFLTVVYCLLLFSPVDALELIFLRHGETSWNLENRLHGQMDISLNENGKNQAAEVKEQLKNLHIDAVYTSDLMRTVQTALIVTDGRELMIHSDARWKELGYGRFEGLLREEVNMEYLVSCLLLPESEACDGIETVEALCRRLRSALAEVISKHRNDTRILIVSHGGVMRTLLESVIDNNAKLPVRYKNCEYFEAIVDENGNIRTGV